MTQPAQPSKAPSPKLSREEIARREIGHTDITRSQAWVLTLAFLAVIALVPIAQFAHDAAAARRGIRQSALPPALAIFPQAWEAARLLFAREASAPAREATGWPPFLDRLFRANNVLLGAIRRCEDDLDRDSLLTYLLLPPVQETLTGLLGAGNEAVYPGRDGWLFHRQGLDYVSGPGFLTPEQLSARRRGGSLWQPAPQPDPVVAILQFHNQLQQRGIALIVMPTPVKPVVHPDRFARRHGRWPTPLQNASYAQFVAELRSPQGFFNGRFAESAESVRPQDPPELRACLDGLAAARERLVAGGVLVFDPAPVLAAEHRRNGAPQYLQGDTHWRPEGVRAAARELARFIEAHVELPDHPRVEYGSHAATASNHGDLVAMLGLPPGQTLYPAEDVTVEQVLTPDDRLWRAHQDAEILLLGDSFSNIYSLNAMGWGESAGLAEQLSRALGRPLDTILRNDAGACATREILSRELRKGNGRLAGKRVVVWQFAARELSGGDWRLLGMDVGEKRASRFVLPPRGHPTVVTATVAQIAAAPRPRTVPYKDHLVAAHLTELESDDPAARGGQAVAYLWSMRDNVWTDAARWRAGDRVALRLQDWAEVADELDGINRTELDDEGLQLEAPCWAVPSGQGRE